MCAVNCHCLSGSQINIRTSGLTIIDLGTRVTTGDGCAATDSYYIVNIVAVNRPAQFGSVALNRSTSHCKGVVTIVLTAVQKYDTRCDPFR